MSEKITPNILYSDEIIEVYEDGIKLRNLFPVLWSPIIKFSEIHYIRVLQPTTLNGKYRLSGTGNFRTWFNVDNQRSKRNKIFILHRNKKWWRYGFSCENSDKVIAILKDQIKLKDKLVISEN